MEKKWYAVFNKDANLIWGYGNTKKQAEKEAKKLFAETETQDRLQYGSPYKTVEVTEDVIEYIENIDPFLQDCLYITNDGLVDINEDCVWILEEFKRHQEARFSFLKEFEAL